MLTREKGSRLLIRLGGVEVWLAVLQVGPGPKARLGFEAPDEVEVVREELVPYWRGKENRPPAGGTKGEIRNGPGRPV